MLNGIVLKFIEFILNCIQLYGIVTVFSFSEPVPMKHQLPLRTPPGVDEKVVWSIRPPRLSLSLHFVQPEIKTARMYRTCQMAMETW